MYYVLLRSLYGTVIVGNGNNSKKLEASVLRMHISLFLTGTIEGESVFLVPPHKRRDMIALGL